jgi:hypothetical protein
MLRSTFPDRGDNKNDGLSLQTPSYSLNQAKKLQGAGAFRAAGMERIQKELRTINQKKLGRALINPDC